MNFPIQLVHHLSHIQPNDGMARLRRKNLSFLFREFLSSIDSIWILFSTFFVLKRLNRVLPVTQRCSIWTPLKIEKKTGDFSSFFLSLRLVPALHLALYQISSTTSRRWPNNKKWTQWHSKQHFSSFDFMMKSSLLSVHWFDLMFQIEASMAQHLKSDVASEVANFQHFLLSPGKILKDPNSISMGKMNCERKSDSLNKIPSWSRNRWEPSGKFLENCNRRASSCWQEFECDEKLHCTCRTLDNMHQILFRKSPTRESPHKLISIFTTRGRLMSTACSMHRLTLCLNSILPLVSNDECVHSFQFGMWKSVIKMTVDISRFSFFRKKNIFKHHPCSPLCLTRGKLVFSLLPVRTLELLADQNKRRQCRMDVVFFSTKLSKRFFHSKRVNFSSPTNFRPFLRLFSL